MLLLLAVRFFMFMASIICILYVGACVLNFKPVRIKVLLKVWIFPVLIFTKNGVKKLANELILKEG